MPDFESLGLVDLRQKDEDRTPLHFTPTSFNDYLGQKVIKEKLQLYVSACMQRAEPLDHMLLFGPPGLGKTTLATVVAKELKVPYKITSAPAIERSGDLVAMLSGLEPREVLFIDEIHRLAKPIEEILYAAMESFCIDMMIGQGTGAKSVRLPINPFTLIGATTKTASVSAPLQTRFGIVERLDFYDHEALAAIALQTSGHLSLNLTDGAAAQISRRARGTPRIVKRIVRRVRDFAQVEGIKIVDESLADKAMTFLGIDKDGLNALDRSILSAILNDFSGGPVGLETLSAMLGEDRETIESFCEPYLIRSGLLQKTTRGRQISPQKYREVHARFGKNAPLQQESIFKG